MTYKFFYSLITACTIALGSASMTNAEEVTVPIYRETAVVEGGDRAPLQIEETADEGGLQITLQYRENAYNSLKFTIDPPVDTEILNHLKFRSAIRVRPCLLTILAFSAALHPCQENRGSNLPELFSMRQRINSASSLIPFPMSYHLSQFA